MKIREYNYADPYKHTTPFYCITVIRRCGKSTLLPIFITATF
ncbi:MAG: hypothetical protein PHU62_07485 [Bacteroidales bacterium]|nr:hypothetical protein [Bacteroidales bacterium]MDD4634395.1 hypothetical protein [Bacteroidales bacterium]